MVDQVRFADLFRDSLSPKSIARSEGSSLIGENIRWKNVIGVLIPFVLSNTLVGRIFMVSKRSVFSVGQPQEKSQEGNRLGLRLNK